MDDYNLKKIIKICLDNYNVCLFCQPRFKNYYLNNYEAFTLELILKFLSIHKENIFVDIGSHYGYYSIITAKKYKKAKILAFEPVPENLKILRKNIKFNKLKNIKLYNYALSNKNGLFEFKLSEASDSSGFHGHPLTPTIKTIKAKTKKLDNIIKSEKLINQLSVIKIDTEGHEIEVLDGMKKIIKKNNRINFFIEFNPKCLLHAGKKPEDLLIFLEKNNFITYAIDEINKKINYINKNNWNNFVDYKKYINILAIKKERLKIIFFSHTAGLGGSERSLLELIDKLLQKDVLITVILPCNGPLKKFLDEKGVITEIISYSWWAKIEKLSPQEIIEKNTETLKNLLSAIPRLKELNPDVIYTNTVVIPWGAITAIILNKPHIWHLREFGKIDHGLHFDLKEKEVKKFINTTSNAVITNSKALYDFYKDEVDKKKMSVAYNYIQISKKLLEEKPKINPFKNKDTLKLLILATITPSKGQLDAVLAIHEIIKKNYKVELAIIGQKNNKLYLEKIEKYIKDNNLESFIHIFDFIDNPYPVIKLADIVLNCSVNEAFGRTTVEAMLLKKPVIGTKRGGTLELIKEGVNGFHYESGNYKELAKKIEFFILNKNKIKELAKNGYEFIKENITKKKSWGKIYKIIKKVATENPCFNNYQIFIEPIVNILKENVSSFIYQSQLQQQSYIKNLEDQINNNQSQIQNLETQIKQLQNHNRNLETQLNNIKSAKFFRLWQSYCKIRDKILKRKI